MNGPFLAIDVCDAGAGDEHPVVLARGIGRILDCFLNSFTSAPIILLSLLPAPKYLFQRDKFTALSTGRKVEWTAGSDYVAITIR